MDKAIQTNVITAVVTAGVLGVLGWGAGVFEAGADALDEAQIEAVIKRVMVTDKGNTYAATLASIDGSLIALNTNVEAIKEVLDDLENAVGALAAE